MSATDLGLDLSRYKLGWSDEEDYVFKPKKGLNEDIIREMSWMKGEPDWMRDFRLKSYGVAFRRLGRGPGVNQEHLREAGHSRGRAQVPGRRHRPVRVRGRVSPQPRRP